MPGGPKPLPRQEADSSLRTGLLRSRRTEASPLAGVRQLLVNRAPVEPAGRSLAPRRPASSMPSSAGFVPKRQHLRKKIAQLTLRKALALPSSAAHACGVPPQPPKRSFFTRYILAAQARSPQAASFVPKLRDSSGAAVGGETPERTTRADSSRNNYLKYICARLVLFEGKDKQFSGTVADFHLI